jgi:hypothetical protein
MEQFGRRFKPKWRVRRLQRKREKGWRIPEGAVYVGRGSKWGNPFKVNGTVDQAYLSPLGMEFIGSQWAQRGAAWKSVAVSLYKRALKEGYLRVNIADVKHELAGRNLMCWCAPDSYCHADILMEIANG